MTVQMKTTGGDILQRALSSIHDSRAWDDLYDTIGSYGVSSTQQRFLDQTDPEGKKWKPSGRARTGGGRTLQDSNRLFQSLTFQTDGKSVAWGTNVVYAAIHQFGGTIRKKSAKKLFFRGLRGFVSVDEVNIPARAFLGINDDDRDEIKELIDDWLMRGFA